MFIAEGSKAAVGQPVEGRDKVAVAGWEEVLGSLPVLVASDTACRELLLHTDPHTCTGCNSLASGST